MRTQTFDIIRVLACFMVVCIHAPLPGDNANGLFLSTLSYFTAPCIGLFFMLSGALLLPVRTGTKEFLKKRLAKVCFPLLVWSIFYICCNVYRGAEETNILRTVCSLPFSTQGNPVLWFMYTLIGLYLLAPILSHWLTVVSRRELEFYLALWGITLCYPILTYVVDCNRSNTAMLHYFTGYIGYFVLGYYLKTYPKRLSFRTLVPAMILSVAAPVLCKCFRIEVDFYEMFWYLSVFVVIQCLFWWRCIMAIGGGEKPIMKMLTTVSRLSFGIYLIHIFIMRYVLWHWDFVLSINSYTLQTGIIVALTFVLSAGAAWLISLLPYAEYIIGYKSSRK